MNKHALRRAAAAAACLTTVLTVSAGAVSSADIKKDLDKALQQRNAAHQLAENARALGAEEHHYTIWYAKQMWNEHNETVIDLTKQYNAAVAEEKKKAEENPKGRLLGTFKCTYYTGAADEGGNITALGTPVTPWYTVAVDPRVIPLGSKIRIEGYDGIFYCADTGSAIKGSILDIAVGSKSEASNLGVQYHKVYLVK
jgi:3D (Asp-Asp-Asp) domain-containing protein